MNPNHDERGRFASGGGSSGRAIAKAKNTQHSASDYRKLAQFHSRQHVDTIARTTGPNADAVFKLAKSHEHKAKRAMQASRAAENRARRAQSHAELNAPPGRGMSRRTFQIDAARRMGLPNPYARGGAYDR